MTDVFISYSRKDKAFVRRLFNALESTGRDAWVDWESIPYSVEWLQEIWAGIDESDNFIFVVSPYSLASKICHEEVAYARQHNKRIIPVIRYDVDIDAELAPLWAAHDWEKQAR